MARLIIRIDFEGRPARLGPGKVALLEAIEATGSITAAAKALGMSYRRAWMLLEESNALFSEPLTETAHGGRQGGGAMLTAFGSEVVKRYRNLEAAASVAAHGDVRFFEERLRREE